MAKIVNFDVQKELGKSFSILDTPNNCKLTSKGLKGVFKAIDELDAKADKKNSTVDMTDYSNTMRDKTVDGVVELLHLNESEAKKLREDVSFSEVQDFYANCCKKFVGYGLPTMAMLTHTVSHADDDATDEADKSKMKTVDPKSTAEE